MKKMLLLISLAILVGCGSKKENLSEGSKMAIESFVKNVKEIEEPAAAAFTNFATALEQIGGEDSISLEEITKKATTGIKECQKAVASFGVLANIIPETGVEDTVRLLLTGSSVYLKSAYDKRIEAIIELGNYFQTGDKESFEKYFDNLKKAGEESSKAFGAIAGARAKAASLEKSKD